MTGHLLCWRLRALSVHTSKMAQVVPSLFHGPSGKRAIQRHEDVGFKTEIIDKMPSIALWQLLSQLGVSNGEYSASPCMVVDHSDAGGRALRGREGLLPLDLSDSLQ